MNMADRIQYLRKINGISQEELADKIGVSRQAVSKWESEQSIPDIEKIITMSDLFEVTTDYIIKGIETSKTGEKQIDAGIFAAVSTALNFIGLIVSAAMWYEKQVPMALVAGLIFMALGCVVFGIIGLTYSAKATRDKAKNRFWSFNVWILTFIPLSFIYNVLFSGIVAPYPILTGNTVLFFLFWFIYIAICLCVDIAVIKHEHAKI